MLGSFHAAKCIEHCIGKYITGTGVMALKSVLEGTNYARSLKAILILTHAIDSLKLGAFVRETDMSKYGQFLYDLKTFQEALSSKDRNVSRYQYRMRVSASGDLKSD